MMKSLLVSSFVILFIFCVPDTFAEPRMNQKKLQKDVVSQEFILIATVLSAPRPLPGQNGRSSGNFSTVNTPDHASNLIWQVTIDGKRDNTITFNVKRDDSVWFDNLVFHRVNHGLISPVVRERSLYIANPDGAGSKEFQVWIFALSPGL